MAYDISWNVVLFLDYLDQLDVSDGALDDLAAWIPGLKTDLPANVRVVLSTLPNDRNKQMLRQAKLYMGDDSFVEVKPIDLKDEGVSRTAFGTMMELRASREGHCPQQKVLYRHLLLWRLFTLSVLLCCFNRKLSNSNCNVLLELVQANASNASPIFLQVALDVIAQVRYCS